MYRLKKILRHKYLWFIVFLIVIILSYIRINLSFKSNYNGIEKVFKLEVLDKKYKNDRYTITLKGKEKIISNTSEFPYDVGDIVYIEGNLEKVNKNTIPNNFNYQKYLQSRGIYWQLKIKKISLVKKNSNLWNKVKSKIISKIEKLNHKEYLYAFLLGDTSRFFDDMRSKYQLNGLSYILSIGSIQIMMFIKLLEKIEVILRLKKLKKLIINILFVLLYINITNMIIGVLRSGLCYILRSVLNYKKVRFKYYNIILFVGSILLIINPYYIIDTGFLYSFSISLGISLLSKRIKGNLGKRILTISFIAFIIGLPITMYNNYEINFLAIILSFIILPIFNYLVFPLCIIVFILPFISPIFNLVITIIEYFINLFSKITFLTFIFRKPSMIIVIIYYLVIILFFRNKKWIFLLILLMFFHHNINNIIKEKSISFLDVGQADAIVLKINNDFSLIDTGGEYYEHYDEIIKYIKSLGGNKLKQIILTHGDYDHMGEAINLVNNFKVEKVIFNCGPYNDLEKELIKVLDKKKIKYYSCIKELNIDNNKLYFLQTKEYDNENDNSNVIYTELGGYKFMFMGDASITTEKEILDKYNLPKIDVLKVGHHGSKTSSGKEFIDEVNPEYSIISVGKNNKYGHPNKEVLDNLNGSKVYRTDINGSIIFMLKGNKIYLEVCVS